MRWPTTWVWDTSVSGFLIAILFVQSLQLTKTTKWKDWALFGFAWGIAALTNPSLLSFLPASGLFPMYRLWRSRQLALRPVMLSALVFTVLIAPWIIRNRIVFGTWVFIRSNAPFEFSLGNYHGSNGLGWGGKHPTRNRWEYAKYERMGELAYVAEKKRGAVNFVKQSPQEFVELCGVRIAAFWTGSDLNPDTWPRWMYWPLSALMLAGLIVSIAYRENGAWLYFWLMLSYPFTFYLVFSHPRYRYAIEPEMLLLSTYFVSLAIKDIRARFVPQRQLAQAAGKS